MAGPYFKGKLAKKGKGKETRFNPKKYNDNFPSKNGGQAHCNFSLSAPSHQGNFTDEKGLRRGGHAL